MIEAEKLRVPSRSFAFCRSATVLRSSLPTSVATWNIVSAPNSAFSRSSGALVRSSSWLITACVVARLPAVISAIERSPGTRKWNILRNTEMLSTPELVRVSLINTSPFSSISPQQ